MSPRHAARGFARTFSPDIDVQVVPGITETFTRVPVGAPLFTGPEDPQLAKVVGVVFLVLAVLIALQLRQVHARIRRGDVLPA